MTQTAIGVASFTVESSRVPSVEERAAFRSICQLVGVVCKSGEEAATSSELLRVLVELARAAGGPAPLPEPPATIDLEEQQANSGNERVIEIAAMTELRGNVERWQTLRDSAAARIASWHLTQRLLAHGQTLEIAEEMKGHLAAIEGQRSLLAEPDPLLQVRQSLATALRDALTGARDQISGAHAAARATLEDAEGWAGLDETKRDGILTRNDLLEPPKLEVGSDDELLASLDRLSLGGWADKLRAVPTALEGALLELAQIREPEARPVRLPHATLKSPDDVKEYVAKVHERLEAELKHGPIVVSGA